MESRSELSEMDLAQCLVEGKSPPKKEKPKRAPAISREELFQEMLTKQTYTDMVEIILKYSKSVKGTPADMVDLFQFISGEIKKLFGKENMELDFEGQEESKLLSLVKNFQGKDETEVVIEFHFKMLYSVNKNKKTPTYMLKSILISLDKVEFDKAAF